MGKRAIVIEDRSFHRDYYIDVLRKVDFDIKVVSFVDEGAEDGVLNIISDTSPHVVFVHFNRKMDRSVSFIAKINQVDPTVSIIYVTAHNDRDLKLEALSAGAYAMLNRKKADRTRLNKIIRKAYKESVKRKISTAKVFVLMPFADEFKETYEQGIKKSVMALGYSCHNAEDIPDGDIMSQVRAKIREARVVIADMTGRNPNVLYEVGYAHALKKKTILLCQNRDDIPFDVYGQKHIIYKKKEISKLKKKLRGVLKKIGP